MIIEDKKIIFIHIPKTGGTSIARVLGSESDEPKYKHDNIRRVCDMIDDDISKYLKFSFVRNPWEREASWFMFGKRRGYPHFKNLDFDTWIRQDCGLVLDKTEESFLHVDGQLGVDDIGIFEKGLEPELKRILGDRIDIPEGSFPHRFKEKYDMKYSSLYNSQELVDIVANRHNWVINTFNYEFKRD